MASRKSGQVWATEPNALLEPHIEKGQTGTEAGRAPLTVAQVFKATVAKFPNANAMALKRADQVGYRSQRSESGVSASQLG